MFIPSPALALLAAVLCTAAPAQVLAQTQLRTELQLGETALLAKDQPTAALHFTNALKLDPANAEAHANLGALAFFRNDCPTAVPHLRAALAQTPTLSKVRALLSICEHRANDPAAAADMQTAFNTLEDPNLRLQLGMELANLDYVAGDLEKTTAVLNVLLNLAPENIDLLFFAQRVYSELAENTLNKLAVLTPHSARMEQLIAERLINAGDLKDAIRHYRDALALNPKLPGVHYELAEALLQNAPHDPTLQAQALAELKAGLAVDGDTAKIEAQLGRIALAQADTTAALAHFQRAFALDPSSVQAQLGLADVYRQQDKPEQAATYLRMAEKLDPLEPTTHYKLSQVDRQLHLDAESTRELKLYTDLRAVQDKVKLLYQQMTPQTAASDPAAASP